MIKNELNKMQILAHRGIMYKYPENSIISFKNALANGFGIELDIHRTKDGSLVVIHDSNLKRLTGVDASVMDLDIEEIKKLNYHMKISGKTFAEKIPTLTEVLTLLKKHDN